MDFRDGEYTLEDYYALPDDLRVELIDGSFCTICVDSFANLLDVFLQIFNPVL